MSVIAYSYMAAIICWSLVRPWKGHVVQFIGFYISLVVPGLWILTESAGSEQSNMQTAFAVLLWAMIILSILVKLRFTKNVADITPFGDARATMHEDSSSNQSSFTKGIFVTTFILCGIYVVLYGPMTL